MRPLLAAVRAETVRTRGSAAAYLPWLGLVIAGISFAGILITPDSQERAALLWQTLYATGMAAPLLTLLAGLTTAREVAAREGGTEWRATNTRIIVLARILILAALSALFHALAFGTVIPLSLLAGAPTDIAGILWAGAGCWIATLGVLALAYIATEAWGLIPVFLAAWVWQAIGTLAAEAGLWTVLPPTWAVRAMLPLLGAHQNGVPLDPTDPLAQESPALALTLGLLLTAVVVGARLRGTGAARTTRIDNRPVGRRSARPGKLGAVRCVMRSRAVIPLCAAAIVLAIAVAAVYPNSYLLGLHSYAMLPIGVCVVAVLTWQTLTPGWRILVLRRSNVLASVRTWLVLCVTSVTLAVTFGALANSVLRGDPDPATIMSLLRSGMLWLMLGTAGVLGALWISVRYGTGWALGATVVITTLGITLGGDVLAETWLWILGPTAWPLTADTPARLAIAAPIGLLMATAMWLLSGRALRTATARGI
ncbi:ABC-2 family transporter permease [Actinoalloteichus hymeniacidonis]|uniref:ABC-2 family transporter protein n=1 Tax=Actinoalloteichus hymeniacidonis TaxID=340345 RepID=A0AAC9HN48_9PSEU|nr:hypothetical protein [Actinoalloteichus hymeniacidonis]AOS62214.1 hypothetical protein TL08_06965 [Actinoalloteichus hymeniacidonis]MBB5909761.1 ABC-2 type transport system permease protein [Actinoalloteichus hymeniacidonis]